MKAEIIISRSSNGMIYLAINDSLSRIQFVELCMTPEDFGNAITGLYISNIEMETRGLEHVGKKKIIEERTIVCPLKTYNKNELEQWLIDNAQEEGWILNSYLGSQSSVSYTEDNSSILKYSVIKYV